MEDVIGEEIEGNEEGDAVLPAAISLNLRDCVLQVRVRVCFMVSIFSLIDLRVFMMSLPARLRHLTI